MNSIVNIIAAVSQLVIMIYSAATYGIQVGLLMLALIILNALQAATRK